MEIKNKLLRIIWLVQSVSLKFKIFLFPVQNSTVIKGIEVLKKFKYKSSMVCLERIGGENDGGYAVPIINEDVAFVISPGVGPSSSFEEYYDNMEIPSLLIDASVDRPPIKLRNAVFLKKYLGVINNKETITLSESIEFIRTKNQIDNTKRGILQMDIEGSEYPCLLSAPDSTLREFSIIIIEFHMLDRIVLADFQYMLSSLLDKMKINFEIVHIHPNNCCGQFSLKKIHIPRVVEVTFLAKDILSNISKEKMQYKYIDQPCNNNTKEINLSSWWQF